ncbi:MAG TPA: hypothetical protein VF942_16030, partial [Acidimicrobiales bacterium]
SQPPAPQPALLQTNTSLGSAAQVNLGTSCTGVSIASLSLVPGCTTTTSPGITASSSLLGGKPIHVP